MESKAPAAGWKINSKIGVAIVLLCGLSAAAVSAYPSPRLLVVCLLAALLPTGMIWQGLARLNRRRNVAQEEIVLGIPTGENLAHSLLKLEAQLEHAPIALFSIASIGGNETVTALNVNARRLLAPGRATDIQHLHQQIVAQAAGQRSMLSLDTEQGGERALVAASAVTLQGATQRLVALMPVESELEAEALNAWRQLVHVLTHEIMNSLTPVASLSRTAHDLLAELRADLPADVADDLSTALDAISRRAASLEKFVSSYRSLSNLPAARPQTIELQALFNRLTALLAPGWQSRNGQALFSVAPASLQMVVDPDQLEQALINLLKNAADATSGVAQPEVLVSARLSRGGRLRIEVSDNGPGVESGLIAHIFTPFFTTKQNGGGIGLAMVRQLVHANRGTVRYARSVKDGARFILTF